MWKTIKEFILDILFPKFCLNCNREGEYLCEDCLYLTDISDRQYCPFCWPPKIVIDGKTCRFCRRNKKLNGLFSAVSYDNFIVKNLIRQFKYKPYYLKDLAKPLSQLIIAHFIKLENGIVEPAPLQIFLQILSEIGRAGRARPSTKLVEGRARQVQKNLIIIPVPLHKKKLKERGYNQAEEIGKILSEYYKIPIYNDILIKIKQTLSQADLNKNQRKKNIIGAFSVQNRESIRNKKILLVDDVFTTGSTMEECARILKLSGAKEVWGVTVARG